MAYSSEDINKTIPSTSSEDINETIANETIANEIVSGFETSIATTHTIPEQYQDRVKKFSTSNEMKAILFASIEINRPVNKDMKYKKLIRQALTISIHSDKFTPEIRNLAMKLLTSAVDAAEARKKSYITYDTAKKNATMNALISAIALFKSSLPHTGGGWLLPDRYYEEAKKKGTTPDPGNPDPTPGNPTPAPTPGNPTPAPTPAPGNPTPDPDPTPTPAPGDPAPKLPFIIRIVDEYIALDTNRILFKSKGNFSNDSRINKLL
jgi:arsenate reductase-like glutaredoxin family protein